MPEHNSRQPARGTVTELPPSELLDVLLRATDNTPDAWAVFGIVRDAGDEVVDLRLVYGNAGYWELSGLTPVVIGRSAAEVAPQIDWTTGLAAMLIQAARSGSSSVDRNVRTRPQTGPLAGQERVFEVELTARPTTRWRLGSGTSPRTWRPSLDSKRRRAGLRRSPASCRSPSTRPSIESACARRSARRCRQRSGT